MPYLGWKEGTEHWKKAILELHDDLDDDDDGSISSSENNEFISEYGLSTAGSIAAMIGDSDGRIFLGAKTFTKNFEIFLYSPNFDIFSKAPAEFLTSWKKSEVFRWNQKQVIEWIKSKLFEFSFKFRILSKFTPNFL